MRKKITGICLSALMALNCYAQRNDSSVMSYQASPIHMQSRWAKDVSTENALREYPRPQLQRKKWQNLNGLWEYAITDSITLTPRKFDGNILVPFPIESALSGVQKRLLPDKRLWYRKTFKRPSTKSGEHIILNFGAIDWQATIFINNKQVGQHTGGYQKFSFDITTFLDKEDNEILIKVYDPSDQGPNPHGKQVLNPANIYYTPSSGIWQTVWVEIVAPLYITNLKTTPDIDNGTLELNITTTGKIEKSRLEIIASKNGKTISVTKTPIAQDEVRCKINIPNARLWSPNDPFLYDLSIKIIKGNKTVDEIKSYFGMRKINIQKDEKGADRIFLNNKYTFNLGTLDQGFWPEGLYTAPTDEALEFDIKTIKSLGFNTIRKHIKIEPERWYYHADRIGILVWQDFVNPPHGLPSGSKEIFETEMRETIDQLYNHPSIVTWVLFNERWGAYDQARLTTWLKKYDSSRIIDGHSGEMLYVNDQLRDPAVNPWEGSDMTDVHSYPNPRNAPPQPNKARVVGEFGGIGVSVPDHEWDDMQGWGYIQVSPAELKGKYSHMIQELKKLETEGLSAGIYTQPFDVEGEENGLITYDRDIIKIPVNEIRTINQQLVDQTSGFNLEPKFIIAKNINVNNNDSQYEELLKEFKQGKKDSAFLRRIIIISLRKKDQEQTTIVGNVYIDALTTPFSKENVNFIRKITKTSKDRGFYLFRDYPKKIDSILWENAAINKVKSIIDAEEIAPYRSDSINWEALQQKVEKKYGDIGTELVLGKQMLYYGIEAKNKNWEKYAKYYVLYFERAYKHPEYDINAVTWILYENVNDTKVLEFATNIMKYAIENRPIYQIPEVYDTYANLLHKTNKSGEAIKWEEKALLLGKGTQDEKIYAETLQKMKSGLPTWPQTQARNN